MGRKPSKKSAKSANDRNPPATSFSSNYEGATVHEGNFVSVRRGLVIILRFSSPANQHRALARVESYYESNSEARKYLSLKESEQKRLCPNYEAFNLPLCALHDWLRAMREAEGIVKPQQQDTNTDTIETTATTPQKHWWSSCTNSQESLLLEHLSKAGCLDERAAPTKVIHQHCVTSNLSYLISTTSDASLPHEMLHALYHIHAGYRATAQKAWKEGLLKKTRAVVQQDLLLRGYGPQVWADEFQAYISEDAGEFGKRLEDECLEMQKMLLVAQKSARAELGMTGV